MEVLLKRKRKGEDWTKHTYVIGRVVEVCRPHREPFTGEHEAQGERKRCLLLCLHREDEEEGMPNKKRRKELQTSKSREYVAV